MDASKSTTPESEQSKVCAKCNQAKPIDCFRLRHEKNRPRPYRRGDCNDCRKEKDRRRYWANLESAKASARERYWKNPEQKRTYQRNYTRKNWKDVRRRGRISEEKYRERNPGKIKQKGRLQQLKRRARKAEVNIESVPTFEELLQGQGGRCAYCKCKKADFHVDHIIPLSKGGSHTKDNLQVLCASCNLSKGAKHPLVFAQEQGRLL